MKKTVLCLSLLLGCSPDPWTFEGRGGEVPESTTMTPETSTTKVDPGVGSPCQGSGDCAEGDICYGYRQDVPGDFGSCGRDCAVDTDCGDGAVCDGQSCWKSCEKSEDCNNPSSVCKDSYCMSADGYLGDICLSDSWCVHVPEGICLEGLCSSACETDQDCVQGGVCDLGFCRFPCLMDTDCRADGKNSKCNPALEYCQAI